VPPVGGAATARPATGRKSGSGSAEGLEVQTIKSYRLTDESNRTVGQLRQILGQRHLPDEARVAFDGDRITIEWTE